MFNTRLCWDMTTILPVLQTIFWNSISETWAFHQVLAVPLMTLGSYGCGTIFRTKTGCRISNRFTRSDLFGCPGTHSPGFQKSVASNLSWPYDRYRSWARPRRLLTAGVSTMTSVSELGARIAIIFDWKHVRKCILELLKCTCTAETITCNDGDSANQICRISEYGTAHQHFANESSSVLSTSVDSDVKTTTMIQTRGAEV